MAGMTIAAPPAMPELFEIEETNPLFDSGNVYDATTEIHRYARFLAQHVAADENDLEMCTALRVLTDATGKLRDTLEEYHDAFVAWKEAQPKGGAA